MMNVPGLTRENVASHLQKYRLYLKKMKTKMESASSQQRHPSERDGHQFPGLDMLQSGPDDEIREERAAIAPHRGTPGGPMQNMYPVQRQVILPASGTSIPRVGEQDVPTQATGQQAPQQFSTDIDFEQVTGQDHGHFYLEPPWMLSTDHVDNQNEGASYPHDEQKQNALDETNETNEASDPLRMFFQVS